MSPTDRHYFRLANLYCGPSLNHWRRWGGAGLDASGILAYAHWRRWAGKTTENFVRTPSWASGFAKFEDRVAAIGSTYREGALVARQAA